MDSYAQSLSSLGPGARLILLLPVLAAGQILVSPPCIAQAEPGADQLGEMLVTLRCMDPQINIPPIDPNEDRQAQPPESHTLVRRLSCVAGAGAQGAQEATTRELEAYTDQVQRELGPLAHQARSCSLSARWLGPASSLESEAVTPGQAPRQTTLTLSDVEETSDQTASWLLSDWMNWLDDGGSSGSLWCEPAP